MTPEDALKLTDIFKDFRVPERSLTDDFQTAHECASQRLVTN